MLAHCWMELKLSYTDPTLGLSTTCKIMVSPHTRAQTIQLYRCEGAAHPMAAVQAAMQMCRRTSLLVNWHKTFTVACPFLTRALLAWWNAPTTMAVTLYSLPAPSWVPLDVLMPLLLVRRGCCRGLTRLVLWRRFSVLQHRLQ